MHIDENNKKWNEIKTKRIEAGSKGGKQRQQVLKNLANLANAKDAKQSQANLAVNVNDNVNVNVSTSVDIKENTIVSKERRAFFIISIRRIYKIQSMARKTLSFRTEGKTQMTEPEYQKLLAKYTKKEISDVLESLNNWKDFPRNGLMYIVAH